MFDMSLVSLAIVFFCCIYLVVERIGFVDSRSNDIFGRVDALATALTQSYLLPFVEDVRILDGVAYTLSRSGK